MPFKYDFTVTQRFLRYVQIDTQSDPNSDSIPSSEKQKKLSSLLVEELLAMEITDAHTDDYGYVYATILSNSSKKLPTICFCAHIDTAPDCSGTDVIPILHEHFSGEDIILPDDCSQVITVQQYPYLKNHIGSSIITASGKTLLGGDDKAGVSIIMDMAHYLMQHPEIVHGTIRILFTPDEEIGKGTDKLDMQKLAADFGYTLDGGALGSFEDETFSADGVTITIHGVIAHPGDGKNKLVNALKIVSEIVAALPSQECCPETTSGREGFIHPVSINGVSEKASAHFIVRDFETNKLFDYEQRLKGIAEQVLLKYPKASMNFEVKEQYRNMKEVLDQNPQVSEYALEAYELVGVQIHKTPIRGGTDGCRLSFIGLPCANIFTGMQAIHSKHEWIAINDMNKAVETLVALTQVWELHG